MCQRCSPCRVGCQAATGQARSRASPPGGRGLCLLCVWHYSPALPLPSVQKPSDVKAKSTLMFQKQLQIAPLTPVALMLRIRASGPQKAGMGAEGQMPGATTEPLEPLGCAHLGGDLLVPALVAVGSTQRAASCTYLAWIAQCVLGFRHTNAKQAPIPKYPSSGKTPSLCSHHPAHPQSSLQYSQTPAPSKQAPGCSEDFSLSKAALSFGASAWKWRNPLGLLG